jgi:hypothetical protein
MYLLATTWERIAAAGIAGAVAVAAFALPLKLNILAAIAVAVMAGLALEKTARNAPGLEKTARNAAGVGTREASEERP